MLLAGNRTSDCSSCALLLSAFQNETFYVRPAASFHAFNTASTTTTLKSGLSSPRKLPETLLHYSSSVEPIWKKKNKPRFFSSPGLLRSGGPGQPGGGVPAAVQHALPHAVLVRAGAASAQRGRGLAPPADRRADLPGHQRRLAAGSRSRSSDKILPHLSFRYLLKSPQANLILELK